MGGSDGTQSLKSTEVLDMEKENWAMGASLCQPRANVAICFYNNKLFAVGGFSKRTFLNTMEYLDDQTNEWCSYLPVEVSCIAHKQAHRKNSKTKPTEIDQEQTAVMNGLTNGH